MTALESLFAPDVIAAIEKLVDDRIEARLATVERTADATKYLTVAEAAELLRAKPQRVYDLLSAGAFARVKDGARTLVRRADIDSYLNGGQRRS